MFYVGFRLHDVRKLPPNEIGDWLSGFASSLAFIWLVAGFHLQRRQLDAQREEFRRMAVVACLAEVRMLVQNTVAAEIASFKAALPQYKDWDIGLAWLVWAVLRREAYEPTAGTAEDAISDEALAHAVYSADYCMESIYQACKLYMETVQGDLTFPGHVTSLSRRASLIVRVIDTHKLPYVSVYRRALARMSHADIDVFLADKGRVFGEMEGNPAARRPAQNA
jgi:hypothetical protein